MDTIVINRGKILDALHRYYLNIDKSGKYVTMCDELITDFWIPESVEIIFKSDSGCYPGTIQEMVNSQINYIIDELLDLKIIKKCKTACGAIGYVPGPNYR